jgi:hypothetical protein
MNFISSYGKYVEEKRKLLNGEYEDRSEDEKRIANIKNEAYNEAYVNFKKECEAKEDAAFKRGVEYGKNLSYNEAYANAKETLCKKERDSLRKEAARNRNIQSNSYISQEDIKELMKLIFGESK